MRGWQDLVPDRNFFSTVDAELNVVDPLPLETQLNQVIQQLRLHADSSHTIILLVRDTANAQTSDHHGIVRCRPHRLVSCECGVELQTPQPHEVRHEDQQLV